MLLPVLICAAQRHDEERGIGTLVNGAAEEGDGGPMTILTE